MDEDKEDKEAYEDISNSDQPDQEEDDDDIVADSPSDPIDLYLKEIVSIPLLTAEQRRSC